MYLKKALLLTGVFIIVCKPGSYSQGFSRDVWNEGLTYSLDEKGDRYIRMTLLGQFWARYNQNNPGTIVFDEVKDHEFDFSFRRARIQLMIQPHERVFIYSQFGLNNFNYVTVRKPSFFMHDLSMDYMVVKNHLFVGAGLHSWAASSRFAAPGVASILGHDAPLYQQQLNDETDQFVRNLGVYVKGSVNRLNFRLSAIKPFSYTKSASFNASKPISEFAQFSPREPAIESGTYLEWQFFDKERDKIPYKAGTYLGKKKILNLGAGARYRPKALWYKTSLGDTAYSPLIMASVDVFFEMPLGNLKQYALNLYGAYTYTDFGPGYLRQVSVDNIYSGVSGHIHGPGNAIPMVGTGNSLYAQAGFLLPNLPKTEIRFMPYATALIADFRVIKRPVSVYQAGVNVFIKQQNLKLTAGWENRPYFNSSAQRAIRRNMAVIQLQFSI
jgi:hypothetical protein